MRPVVYRRPRLEEGHRDIAKPFSIEPPKPSSPPARMAATTGRAESAPEPGENDAVTAGAAMPRRRASALGIDRSPP
ncbi:hypothetical protein GCM10010387_34790 [Streptomyces inusitatus]|uniref:Uncharacterized protein n=1 Tax=Streptomyces inusitatus TaxID=68221 RepID=A0A918UVN1_9ACTN|nr:hypothetical protein GCM10010387_34790 [Streptomyces inusitatus]